MVSPKYHSPLLDSSTSEFLTVTGGERQDEDATDINNTSTSLHPSHSNMAPKSNVALLTEGAAYIRRAKKARQDQVEEVKWDDEGRRCVSA